MSEEAAAKRDKLSKPEIATIISLIVQMEGRLELIKNDFYRVYKRKISFATIKDIQDQYEEKIIKLAEKLISDGKDNPLLNYRFRAKLWWRLFLDAHDERQRGYEKVGKDYKPKICWDDKMMARCLEETHKIDMDIRNYYMNKEKKSGTANLTGGDGSGAIKPPLPEEDNDDAAHSDEIDDLVNFGVG